MKITREYIESLVGQEVELVMFDGDVFRGTLSLGNGFFFEKKWYHIRVPNQKGMAFRLSHVKKLTKVNTNE